jgi:hypothetical protein
MNRRGRPTPLPSEPATDQQACAQIALSRPKKSIDFMRESVYLCLVDEE